MRGKRLLLGDEALALGALHAGLSGVYAYPGTLSTEITEFIQGDPLARERGVRSRWCTNEKTAMEAALGVEREHLHVVVPLPKNMEEITRIIREELEYKGVSVIIPQRECMQTLARKNRQKKAAQ